MVCLEESLETHIKHSFSKRVKLGKNPVITVYVPVERVLEGFLLTFMLTKIEKKFGGVVSVISSREVLKIIRERRLNEYLERNKNIQYGILKNTVSGFECYTIKSLEKAVQDLERNSELIKDSQAALLPYTLTDLNEAFLEHVVLGVGNLNILLGGKYLINGVPLIFPYARVDRLDVIALSYALKFTELYDVEYTSPERTCRASKIIKDLISRISLEHPELTHSMLKSIRFFSH